MQEAEKTFLGVSEIYYAARLLDKSTKISSQINFRPYLKVLGCEIIESSSFFLPLKRKNSKKIIL